MNLRLVVVAKDVGDGRADLGLVFGHLLSSAKEGLVDNFKTYYSSLPDEHDGLRSDYLEGVVDDEPQVEDGVGPCGRGQGDSHAGLGAERFGEFCHRVEGQEGIERL